MFKFTQFLCPQLASLQLSQVPRHIFYSWCFHWYQVVDILSAWDNWALQYTVMCLQSKNFPQQES